MHLARISAHDLRGPQMLAEKLARGNVVPTPLAKPQFTLKTLVGVVGLFAFVFWAMSAWPAHQKRRAVDSLVSAICAKKGSPDRPSVGIDPYSALSEPIQVVRRVGACDVAVPHVIALLGHQDPVVRDFAAYVLGELSSDAKLVIPLLVEALQHTNKSTRYSAACALNLVAINASFGIGDPNDISLAVPAVISSLKDDDNSVRYMVAQFLGRVGSDSREATSALVEALNDDDEGVRGMAADSLERIDPLFTP